MPKILLVDDEPAIVEVLPMTLDDARYETRVAHDGIAALKIVDAWLPDVIISDWQMPKMNGEELLNRLKSDDRLRHIHVIAISATPPVLELRLVALLQKPFAVEKLLRLISKTVG
ncbi:response regulator [Caballeronia sp. HLA56]